MRALTIMNPYAALIALPDDDPRAKRVENRQWGCSYRGELAIHAGKSRARIDEAEGYGLDPSGCTFGAVVAVARLAGCFYMDGIGHRASRKGWTIPAESLRRFPWLAAHEHTEGPHCFVLTEVRPLRDPVYCQGAQGLWTPSPEVVEAVRDRLGVLA